MTSTGNFSKVSLVDNGDCVDPASFAIYGNHVDANQNTVYGGIAATALPAVESPTSVVSNPITSRTLKLNIPLLLVDIGINQ